MQRLHPSAMRPLITAALVVFAGMGACTNESVNFRSGKKNSQDQIKPCLAIRGGTEIKAGMKEAEIYEGSGAIQFKMANGEFRAGCSGALIAPNVVLTARHCVADDDTLERPGAGAVFPETSLRFDLLNGSGPSTVKKVIAWENRQVHRDVALMILDKYYPETVPYYRVLQSPLILPPDPPLDVSPLTMVGAGGYADGLDAGSFVYGLKRFGKASYYGAERGDYFTLQAELKQDKCKPEEDSNCLDYLAFYALRFPLPLHDPAVPMICPGDSGSSLFWQASHTHLQTGITSLGASIDSSTREKTCNTAFTALYIPSYSYAGWVREKLAAEIGAPANSSGIVLGRIASTASEGGLTSLVLNEVKVIDDGLNLFAGVTSALEYQRSNDGLSAARLASLNVSVCQSGCTPLTAVSTTLNAGDLVKLRLEKMTDGTGERLIAVSATKPTTEYRYSVEFEADLKDVAAAARQRAGREERPLVLGNSAAAAGSLPLYGDDVRAVLCLGGACAKVSEVAQDIVMTAGKRVKVSAEVIDETEVFIRKIENAEPPVEPSPCN